MKDHMFVILRQKCGTISKREIQQKNCKLFQTTQTLARELTICSSPWEKAALGPPFVEGGGWTFAKMLSYKSIKLSNTSFTSLIHHLLHPRKLCTQLLMLNANI